jgi:hypothetical protein
MDIIGNSPQARMKYAFVLYVQKGSIQRKCGNMHMWLCILEGFKASTQRRDLAISG